MQALLYRARWLGRLSDVSYRNAMIHISNRGWRRDEPGLVSAIEQPSLLPGAIHLLAQEGIDEARLIEQCRVPVDLFHTVTARVPESAQPAAADTRGQDDRRTGGRVASLLERQQIRSEES
jgi:hypothetical protein